MNKEMIKERLLKLRKDIDTLDNLYETNELTLLEGKLISDSEYDEMYMELDRLEIENPEFKDINSPTQRITTAVVDSLEKFNHSSPMLSLEKITTTEGILKFASKGNDNSKIVAEDKLDGLTIVLTYVLGRLQLGVTRGDGYVGEVVTHSVRTFANIPKVIPFKGKLEVRMEALVPYKEFERINASGEYSNPRNLASGTVRQLDATITRERNLIGIVFDVISAEGVTFNDDIEMLEFLASQNFQVVNYKVFENNEEGRAKLVEYALDYDANIRRTLPYMIDGLVFKFNDLKVREELGYTSKFPRWATAFKFKSLESSTTLLGITDQVGKTGQITPVAELQVVNIDGVNISRATLHNYNNIKTKDIRIGDQVIVARANDVIPQIISSIKEVRTGDEVIKETPLICPACGAIAEIDGENVFCTGLKCHPQLEGKIQHFASRNALNIDGLGKKSIETFFSLGILEDLTDIYRLKEKEEEICSLEGFGKRKFDKIVKGVEVSKEKPLNNLIYGLSIRHIGESSARDLAIEFKSMEEIVDCSKSPMLFKERLLTINDFGEAMSNSLIDFFSNEENIEVINALKDFGVQMKVNEPTLAPATDSSTSTISEKVFVVTGNVSHFNNRNELKAKIEELGGKVTGSVSKNTDYLINNDLESASSKNKKAIELNIPILSEEDFLNLIK